jgi:UDP-2,3-diacylglucosamine hydrolase
LKVPDLTQLTLLPQQRVHLIADLHLFPNPSVEIFERWGQTFEDSDHVVILGDLFEAWVENLWSHQLGYENIQRCLQKWQERGITCHLIIGNRDVLAGVQLKKLTGLRLHWGPLLLKCETAHLLLMHGDELLPQDVSYQRFRRIMRHSLTKAIIQVLPLALIRKCAGVTREHSQQKTKNMSLTHFSPLLDGLKHWLTHYPEIRDMMVGHFHTPKKFQLSVDQRTMNIEILEQSHSTCLTVAQWQQGKISQEKFHQT